MINAMQMNEFKGAPGNHSQPLKSVSGEIPQEGEVQWVSEGMQMWNVNMIMNVYGRFSK